MAVLSDTDTCPWKVPLGTEKAMSPVRSSAADVADVADVATVAALFALRGAGAACAGALDAYGRRSPARSTAAAETLVARRVAAAPVPGRVTRTMPPVLGVGR
ncbi:hypothetical protein Mame01_49430 [Microbispora amethystogenes]|nr:hypothetical protein Mame01_49430 [Microbispora amethystogenes]